DPFTSNTVTSRRHSSPLKPPITYERPLLSLQLSIGVNRPSLHCSTVSSFAPGAEQPPTTVDRPSILTTAGDLLGVVSEEVSSRLDRTRHCPPSHETSTFSTLLSGLSSLAAAQPPATKKIDE
ncbi:hypothetical protein PENTCL1PPCAC_23479, partial [Pristionchus entomophagus]